MSAQNSVADLSGAEESSGQHDSTEDSSSSRSAYESDTADAQLNIQSRPRPIWQVIWTSSASDDMSFETLKDTLPSRAVKKNDPYPCTMKHASLGQYELAQDHSMRTIMTKCTSARCAKMETECACRYKINTCEASGHIIMCQEGQHVALDTSEESPRVPKLTAEMKEFVHDAISRNSAVTPHVVFTRICTELGGLAPLESQVQGCKKRWRSKNRDDSMQPVIDICSRSMFELVQNRNESGDELIVFCNSMPENGSLVPDLGDASDESPFRMALTCYSLLEAYATVQQDLRCVIILHVDSTHNMVRQRYCVFILGFSNSCGHFFPLVYYSASQRRAEDVAWSLSYLKRVMLQLFACRFSPQYVMTDADKAQYNACNDEIPASVV